LNSLKNYKNKVIAGKKILLRKLKKGDLKYCIVWLRDPEVNKFLSHGLKDVTEDQELEWYDFISNSVNDLVFAIISKTNKKYIGNCGLHKINFDDKSCEFGIVIGEKNYWNKGFGSDAIKTLTQFAIYDLKLDKIKLNVYEYNHRAIKVYKNCGFLMVDKLKNHHFYSDRYWDTYIMEYKKSKKYS
jgi:RimJ/RimL family protein N-acetyltransferase